MGGRGRRCRRRCLGWRRCLGRCRRHRWRRRGQSCRRRSGRGRRRVRRRWDRRRAQRLRRGRHGGCGFWAGTGRQKQQAQDEQRPYSTKILWFVAHTPSRICPGHPFSWADLFRMWHSHRVRRAYRESGFPTHLLWTATRLCDQYITDAQESMLLSYVPRGRASTMSVPALNRRKGSGVPDLDRPKSLSESHSPNST